MGVDGGGLPQARADGSAIAQTARDGQRAAKLLASVVPLPPPPRPTAGGPQAAAADTAAHTAKAAARLGPAAPSTLAHNSIYMKCSRQEARQRPGAVQAFSYLCALREAAKWGRGEAVVRVGVTVWQLHVGHVRQLPPRGVAAAGAAQAAPARRGT
eukprot:410622-Pleurochrysis_carterae.AAC.1